MALHVFKYLSKCIAYFVARKRTVHNPGHARILMETVNKELELLHTLTVCRVSRNVQYLIKDRQLLHVMNPSNVTFQVVVQMHYQ